MKHIGKLLKRVFLYARSPAVSCDNTGFTGKLLKLPNWQYWVIGMMIGGFVGGIQIALGVY